MRTIISVVGKSHTGKTTLLESLIAELKQRGYRVAIIKHSHHPNDLDTTNKDTWRFSQAGSVFSALNSLDNLAVYRRIDDFFDPREIADNIMWEYDLLLTEGFKGSNYPKIEVHRRELGPELVTDPERLLAVVTDAPLDVAVPQFAHGEVAKVADLIEGILLKNRGDDIDLVVNGKPVALDPSFKEMLSRTLFAMIPSPNGDGEVKSLHLSLRRKQ